MQEDHHRGVVRNGNLQPANIVTNKRHREYRAVVWSRKAVVPKCVGSCALVLTVVEYRCTDDTLTIGLVPYVAANGSGLCAKIKTTENKKYE